jgi:LmbE family N-acetylglucosaminyl deacetylase
MQTIKNLSEIGIRPKTSILAFMPHPDDEAVFISGFLNKASKLGTNIRVVTLTKGEKSTLRYGLSKEDKLDVVRKAELENSFKILGIKNYEILNIPDGAIRKNYNLSKQSVLREIDLFKPEYVLTLELSGIYGHPDHIALSEAVTSVYEELGKPFRLIYSTVDERFRASVGARSLSKSMGISPVEPNLELKLTAAETLRKVRALKAHK